jgi:AcrR family transcriptional regulator
MLTNKTGVDYLMKHIPQHERKTETKKKIVDAAMMLFSSKGYYQTNSKEIAKEAGVAIGSFYSYFTDKKEVLKYILNAYIQEVLSESSASDNYPVCSVDRKAILKDTIVKSFNMHNFTLGFYQQVTMLSIVDEEISLIFKEYQTAILSRISTLLEFFVPDLPDDCREAAGIIIYSAIEGAVHSVKFSRTDIKEDILIDELVRLVDSYLLVLDSGKMN